MLLSISERRNKVKIKRRAITYSSSPIVGVTRFELVTPCSQSNVKVCSNPLIKSYLLIIDLTLASFLQLIYYLIPISFAVNLFHFQFLVIIKFTFSHEQPACGHAVVPDEVSEPSRLEDVTLLLLLQLVHVPAVDAVARRERLLATDHLVSLQSIQGIEEATDH